MRSKISCTIVKDPESYSHSHLETISETERFLDQRAIGQKVAYN